MSLTGKPSLTSPAPFTNDVFWLDLNVSELLSKYRVPSEYADDTIIWGLTLAATNVNWDLEPVKTAVLALGYNTLDAYINANPEPLGNDETLSILYQDAVYSYAKAQLLQQFNSLNRKPNAEAAAKESMDTEQYWLDQSARAVSKLFERFAPDNAKPANYGMHASLI